MSTMRERPNRDALNRAVDVFRDAMRPFVVGHMRRVCGDGAEEAIRGSLSGWRADEFMWSRRRGGSVEDAIDVNDFPRIVQEKWAKVFRSAFDGDRAVQSTLEQIADARNKAAHPGTGDLELEYVRSRLYAVADVLGRIDEEERKQEVEGIRDGLVVGVGAPRRRQAASAPPAAAGSLSGESYWLNMDSTGVVLHKGSCGHVKAWAKPPKWKGFSSERAALNSTPATIRRCGDCFQSDRIDFESPDVQKPPATTPRSGGYWVYEDRPTSRARVHEGACRYCNHGDGMGKGRIEAENEWYGPFWSREDAFRRAGATGQRDVRGCGVCRP